MTDLIVYWQQLEDWGAPAYPEVRIVSPLRQRRAILREFRVVHLPTATECHLFFLRFPQALFRLIFIYEPLFLLHYLCRFISSRCIFVFIYFVVWCLCACVVCFARPLRSVNWSLTYTLLGILPFPLFFLSIRSIFRNGSNHAPSYLKENEAGSGVWRHSLANHGFDSTLRNLIDDSVQEESTTTTTTSSCAMNSSPRQSLHGELDPSAPHNNDNHSAQG